MPAAQLDSVETLRRRDYDDLHRDICESLTRDPRYNGRMTNVKKTDYICYVLEYPREAFDLDVPFSVEDWIRSSDLGLINCGMYLNDLRLQFYSAILDSKDDPATWRKHGEAEFWFQAFACRAFRMQSGNLLVDDRPLQ